MIALDRTLSATFDSQGIARVHALPDRARDVWTVTRYQVTSTSISGTRCTVYRGSEHSGSRIDYSHTGNDDVSENQHGIRVDFGNALIFVWEDGTPGRSASVTLIGEVGKE